MSPYNADEMARVKSFDRGGEEPQSMARLGNPVETCAECGTPSRHLHAGLCSRCDALWAARQTREGEV